MATVYNLKRVPEILDSHGNNEFDIDSRNDDKSDSDTDCHVSGIESDGTSTDEHTTQAEYSSDSYVSEDGELDQTESQST